MSTSTADLATKALTPTTIDTSRPAVPLRRLVLVELRKLVDTRAGFWLVVAMAVVSALVTAGALVFADEQTLSFGQLFSLLNLPTGVLLPVLAILLVTSEWSQRAGLVTFTLEPRRSRVVVAKLATSLVAAAGAVVGALAFAAVGTLVAGAVHGGDVGAWDLTTAGLVNGVLAQLFALLTGFAFAMVVMSSAPAIVLYFVLPTVWSLLGAVLPWLRDNVQEWADFTLAQGPLGSSEWATGDEWARIAVSGTIWMVLPLAVGVWRLLRSEVK